MRERFTPSWIRFVVIAALAVPLAALVASPVVAQAPAQNASPGSAVMSREQLQKLLDESGTALNNLIAARNQDVSKEVADKRDKRGRNVKDDLQQYVMAPDLQTRLKAQQESAGKDLAAGDLPGVQLTLINLRRELAAQIERYTAIVTYWREIGVLGLPGAGVDEKMLRAHGIEPVFNKELAALRTQFDQQIAAGDFVTALRSTAPKYQSQLDAKTSEERRLMLASVDSGGFADMPGAKPTRSCPPSEGTSGTDAPTPRGNDFPTVGDYFPAKLKVLGIKTGAAEVFVVVNAKGCPERALVTQRAEYPEFDEAALNLAVDGRYLPASKDGVGIRSGLIFRVQFDSPE